MAEKDKAGDQRAGQTQQQQQPPPARDPRPTQDEGEVEKATEAAQDRQRTDEGPGHSGPSTQATGGVNVVPDHSPPDAGNLGAGRPAPILPEAEQVVEDEGSAPQNPAQLSPADAPGTRRPDMSPLPADHGGERRTAEPGGGDQSAGDGGDKSSKTGGKK